MYAIIVTKAVNKGSKNNEDDDRNDDRSDNRNDAHKWKVNPWGGVHNGGWATVHGEWRCMAIDE